MTVIASQLHYAAHLRAVAELLPELPNVALVASFTDVVTAKRQGYRRIVLAQHGTGQSYSDRHPAYPGGRGNEAVGLFLAPNEHAAGRWRAAYPAARVEIVGCPRLDELPRRVPDGQVTVAISFHWNGSLVSPEAGSALRDFRGVLPELAKRFHVIGHAHPRAPWPARLAKAYAGAGVEIVAEFDEVCRRADVYVCDNSSTIFEFASTSRPVVLMNARAYRKAARHGLRFWDAADVGIQVDDPAALGDAIAAALDDPPQRQRDREAALNLVYQPRTNGAQTAATAITDWLITQEAAA